ncbi:hypothetical protein DF268_43010 [Streptomyces sp. V2]|nr:hypothetical protein DF268_43010 [Streptomyces sp. V2]
MCLQLHPFVSPTTNPKTDAATELLSHKAVSTTHPHPLHPAHPAAGSRASPSARKAWEVPPWGGTGGRSGTPQARASDNAPTPATTNPHPPQKPPQP